jgi:hypothetical protein
MSDPVDALASEHAVSAQLAEWGGKRKWEAERSWRAALAMWYLRILDVAG